MSEPLGTTLTLTWDDVTAGAMTGQYLYNVTGLLFYTEYNFTLVADYNLTGTVFQSSAVVVSNVTPHGGTWRGNCSELIFGIL